MQFLAIDLGTSFVKGAVLDLDALRLDHIQRAPFPAAVAGLPPRRYELDPDAVVVVVRDIIESLLPRAPDCAGIVMCTQMHSVVLVDQEGQPISNIATWLDQRVLDPHPGGATFFDLLAEQLGPETRRRLGNELRPGLPIGTLFWQAQQGNLPAGATPLTMADFALMRLCDALPGVEMTNAAAAGALVGTSAGRGSWERTVT